MAYFKRDKKNANVQKFIRLHEDMGVTVVADTYKNLQALSQNKTTGEFCKYIAGDENKGVIVGLYTGEEITLENKGKLNISSYIIVAKEDVVGVDFESDFTAITQLKQAGVILTNKIQGTEEA